MQGNCSKITQDGDYSVPLRFVLPDSFSVVSRTFDSLPVSAVYNPPVPDENLPAQENAEAGGASSGTITSSVSPGIPAQFAASFTSAGGFPGVPL